MTGVTYAIMLLIAILIAHLIEEVKTGFRKRFLLGEMPISLFVGINVIVYSFCFATLFLSILDNELAVPFAWILALAMMVNGAGHVGIMAVRRGYFPGGLTAFVLLPVSAYVIVQLVGVQ